MIGLGVVLALTCRAQDGQGEKAVEDTFQDRMDLIANFSNFTPSMATVKALMSFAEKEGMTEKDAARVLTAEARRYRQLAEKAPPEFRNGYSIGKRDTERCVSILQTLALFRDRDTLPLFEEMMTSTEENIRHNGVYGYVKVAEVMESFALIEKLIKNPRIARGVPAPVHQDFVKRIAESPPPLEDMQKVCAFLLEKSQESIDLAQIMDGTLAKHLPGYATSVQRAEMAETLAASSNGGYKRFGQPIKDEISKTPVHERKDFRAKGELLDPERKK